jgi:hypothetical protein
MSDTILQDEDGVRYSYDNLRTQGWLDGHASGLDVAFGFLVERAVALFRDRKDEDATRLRRLADEMVQALRPQMEERSREHAQDFPVVVAAAPPPEYARDKGEGSSDSKRTWMDDDDEP